MVKIFVHLIIYFVLAIWNATLSICIFQVSSLEACKLVNPLNKFEKCEFLSIEDCAYCDNGDPSCPFNQAIVGCYINNYQCSQEECNNKFARWL